MRYFLNVVFLLRCFLFNVMKFPVEDNLSDCGCALLKPQLMTQSNSHWKTATATEKESTNNFY